MKSLFSSLGLARRELLLALVSAILLTSFLAGATYVRGQADADRSIADALGASPFSLPHFNSRNVSVLVAEVNDRSKANANSTRVLSLYRSDGTHLAGSVLRKPCNAHRRGELYEAQATEIQGRDGAWRRAIGFCERSAPLGVWLFWGEQAAPYNARHQQPFWMVIIAGTSVMVGTIMAWIVLSRQVERRLLAIQHGLTRFTDGDLDHRLVESGSGGELDRVSVLINQTLDRSQTLIVELRLLGDQVAHEVKGAVGRIIRRLTELETASSSEAGVTVEQALKDSRDALAAIDAILNLSKLRVDPASDFSEVSLSGVVRDVVEMIGILADEKSQTIKLDLTEAKCLGDRQLLLQLVTNLISNAIKYSPEHTAISVTLREVEGQVVQLVVSDEGPGIPTAQREEVFKPGRRLSRDRQIEGHGYGLSIAHAIALRHAGHLWSKESASGACFVFETASALAMQSSRSPFPPDWGNR